MARHDFRTIQTRRNFPHTGLFSSQKCTYPVCKNFSCRFDFAVSTDIRLRAQHLGGTRQHTFWFGSTQHLRVNIASRKLSMLLKPQGSYRCRSHTTTEVHHHIVCFANLWHQISHPGHVFLLRSLQRPFSSSGARLVSVKHLLFRQS